MLIISTLTIILQYLLRDIFGNFLLNRGEAYAILKIKNNENHIVVF